MALDITMGCPMYIDGQLNPDWPCGQGQPASANSLGPDTYGPAWIGTDAGSSGGTTSSGPTIDTIDLAVIALAVILAMMLDMPWLLILALLFVAARALGQALSDLFDPSKWGIVAWLIIGGIILAMVMIRR